ncbi:MAG: hypothetical protein WCO84_06810, partial [bacterium]
MKKAPLLLLIAAVSTMVFGAGNPPDTTILQGVWTGSLVVGGASLRIVFHVELGPGGATATMDSPDQGVRGIPVASVSLDGSRLVFDVRKIGGSFEGSIDSGGMRVTGFWK